MKAIKLLFILAILAIVAYFAGVWYSGNRIQQHYEEKVARLSEQLKTQFPEIKITQQSYEKSFFSARSVLTVEVKEKPFVLLYRAWCAYVDKEAFDFLSDVKYFRQAHDVCTEVSTGKPLEQTVLDIFGEKAVFPGDSVYFKYHIVNDIAHGPWLSGKGFGMAYVKSKVTVDADHLPAGVKDYIDSLQIDSVRGFSNDFDTHIVGKKIDEQVFKDAVRIGFDGFDLRLTSHDKRMKMDTQLTIPRFYYELFNPVGEFKPHRVEITNIVSNGSGLGPKAPFSFVSDAKSSFSFEKIEVTSPSMEGKWVRCENFKGNAVNTVKDKLLSSDQTFSMQCGTNAVSPTLNVTLDGAYKVKNFHYGAFVNFAKAYIQLIGKEIAKDIDRDYATNNYRSRDEQLMAAFFGLLEKNLPDLVAPGPEMRSEYVISINDTKEAFRMVSDVKFKPLTEDEKTMAWYVMLPSKLSVKVTYSVSADLYEKGLPEYEIKPLVELVQEAQRNFSKPVVVKDGNRYSLEYGYDNGNIVFNGEIIPLTDLFRR